jgi:hypothetical protein
MVLPAGNCGYVCVVPIWLQDLLVVGGPWAAIGMRRPPTSAIRKAPGLRVVA